MIRRRSVLAGLLAAPAIIRTPGLLMPVRRVLVPAPGLPLRGDEIIEIPPGGMLGARPWMVSHLMELVPWGSDTFAPFMAPARIVLGRYTDA